KGDKRNLRVESRGPVSPLDPVLRLIDNSGKTVAESDDTRDSRDPSLTFSAPTDGDYRVVVKDLNDRGGPGFVYALEVKAPGLDFRLSLPMDRFDATPGKTTSIRVVVERLEGFSETIELMVQDLPDGFTAEPVMSRPGDASAKSVTLELRADGCSHPGP